MTENVAALKLWKSLGYYKVGEYVKERFIDGEYKNVTIMEKFIQH